MPIRGKKGSTAARIRIPSAPGREEIEAGIFAVSQEIEPAAFPARGGLVVVV